MAWAPPAEAEPGEVVEQLGRDVLATFTEAEERLLGDIARRARNGAEVPQWASEKAAAVREVRLAVERVLTQLRGEAGPAAAEAVLAAHQAGASAALTQLHRLGALDEHQVAALREVIPGMDAATLLAADLTSRLDALHLRILRWGQDAYQTAVAAAAPAQLLGTATTRSAQRAAWDRLLADGVTGFIDRAGRCWNLATYVEMATRTATARAWNDGHLARLDDLGVDLVTVSRTADGCAPCAAWEGRILARTGGVGRRAVTNELTGEAMTVEVVGTVDEARASGLFHPNCRHTLLPYLPGVTRVEPTEHDAQAENDREHLRSLERQVRKEKRQVAGALTPEQAQRSRAKVRALQAEIRQHIDDTGLVRKRYREQVNLGHGTTQTARRRHQAQAETLGEGQAERARLDAVAAEQARRREQQRLAAEQAAQKRRAAELAKLTDDQLDEAIAQASAGEDFDRLAALVDEADRRQAARQAAEARRQQARQRREQARQERQAAQVAEYERLVNEGMDAEQAWAQATGTTVEAMRRHDAVARLRADGYTGRGFDDLARAAYRDYVAEQYWHAEDATNGYLLNQAGEAAGIDPRELFTGPASRARKWASDELKAWWDGNGRMTFDEYAAWLLDDAGRARDAGFRTGGEDWLQ
ncbi:hypothetical protein GCM10012275_39590 [Longimycelium tulufanense]|uniref:Phage minor capsid protein 2 n=1 Tax=Longimycelium tulufanense TaxID=907463 RepID=A0A8J3FV55_9PSEU|nr:phage minor capsid protein [Longimycelium tulufanense]GGM65125.1 hypothetical protein GCM10012275_39590 [Longimycelium tulufanense]